ncbi:hypothetical protein CSUI_003231 [Cystoisospora suis]|uniref:Uncharacterized protein n=1 Tax=Cystoisospora suis TaxID=483139 RepID=A0A2C6L536_9APIC|nr:hypothetical protein CSUI_003231 [Cystoisospora suis]
MEVLLAQEAPRQQARFQASRYVGLLPDEGQGSLGKKELPRLRAQTDRGMCLQDSWRLGEVDRVTFPLLVLTLHVATGQLIRRQIGLRQSPRPRVAVRTGRHPRLQHPRFRRQCLEVSRERPGEVCDLQKV